MDAIYNTYKSNLEKEIIILNEYKHTIYELINKKKMLEQELSLCVETYEKFKKENDINIDMELKLEIKNINEQIYNYNSEIERKNDRVKVIDNKMKIFKAKLDILNNKIEKDMINDIINFDINDLKNKHKHFNKFINNDIQYISCNCATFNCMGCNKQFCSNITMGKICMMCPPNNKYCSSCIWIHTDNNHCLCDIHYDG